MSSLLLSTFFPPIYSFLNVTLYSRDGKEHRQKRKKETEQERKPRKGSKSKRNEKAEVLFSIDLAIHGRNGTRNTVKALLISPRIFSLYLSIILFLYSPQISAEKKVLLPTCGNGH